MRDFTHGDEDATVAFLAAWAGDGPALELGIGTGRIALRLAAATGIQIDGIEIAQAMIDQLKSKPGAGAVNVTIGDFADMSVDGRYRLVYVVGNSFFNLLTQDDEVRCFSNVAAHLHDDGAFIIESMLPDFLFRMENQQYVRAEHVGVDEVRFDLLRHDPTTQVIEENHVRLTAGGPTFNPIVQRYCWPAEMDLMARMTGLRLRERWAGWDRRPWSPDLRVEAATRLVSVYSR